MAGRKFLAPFGRAEARDFADIYVLAHRFGKAALLHEAGRIDSGFDRRVLGQMMSTLGRFHDDEIAVDAEQVDELRRFFAAWAIELVRDRP